MLSDKAESLRCCRFHFLSDLFHGFTSERLFVFLSRNDLLREFTQLFNILTGINLSEGRFKMESLFHRQVVVGHHGEGRSGPTGMVRPRLN